MDASERYNEEYVLGHSEHELERLSLQAKRYESFTTQFLRDAGIRNGMRVLDIGCGIGDVTFLVAQMVGPTGLAFGVDNSPVAIATAQRRAHELSLHNTQFFAGDINILAFNELYDAIVGRFVLQFLPDPSATLRELAKQVRPGGVIAFQEIDNSGCHASPELPTLHQCMRWIIEGMQRSGADPLSGLHLWSTYHNAGLPPPTLSLQASVGAGPDNAIYSSLAALVRSLLPTLENFNIATANEVAIETLAERLCQEAVAMNATIVGQNIINAIVQIPLS